MLCSSRINVVVLVVGSLLVANISDVLGSRASGFRGEKVQQDSKQTPYNETGTFLESITLQSDNTYNSGPNSKNVYGSITQQTNEVHSSSPDLHGSYPTVIVSDSIGDRVSYTSLGRYQPQNYHGQSNPLFNLLRAFTVRSGNTYNSAPSSKNFYGSIAQQNNRIYSFPGHRGQPSTESGTVIASGAPGQGLSQSRLSYSQPLQYHGKLSPLFNRHGAVTIQTGNTYKAGPNSKNVYGSITHQTGEVYASDVSGQATPCVMGSVTIQKGNTYSSAPNSENVYGSITRQTNQVYSNNHHGSSNGTGQRTCTNFGSLTIQEGNTYS